jgi:NAD(P)-dependent dehydrogenase (short-subunit alcohol dehydrogenase family)
MTEHVALVTGGSRGIGLAVAKALVRDGVSVVIAGRDETSLASARTALEGSGPGAIETVTADVRSAADVERAVAKTVGRFGGLDVLVNNAGIGGFTEVGAMTTEQWAATLDTNLTGVFYACRAALPHLRQRGGGSIINISSLAGTNPFAGGAAYCASKAGLNAFSEALMQEVRHDDIRVSVIAPGSVATGFSGGAPSGADWKLSPDDVAEMVMELVRLPRRALASRVEMRPSRPKKN